MAKVNMRHLPPILLAGLLALCGLSASAQGTPPQVFHFYLPPSEKKIPESRQYTRMVLKAALERTTREFGSYELQLVTSEISEARQLVEVEKDSNFVNTIALPSRRELDKRLLPVRIPINLGFLGFRVFLIRAEDQHRFDAIRTVQDLQAVRIGQGAEWVDVKILEDAGLQVERGADFEGLFEMLIAKRFDAFSRGVIEATRELEARKTKFPNLAIEKGLLLYYPMPGYFWFSNTPQGRLRAKRVQAGLSAMVADGALRRMFLQEYGAVLKQLDLPHRRLLRIDNSQLGPEEPLADTTLWYNPIEVKRK